MRIAVTGASGLIGTALGAALQADGHDVRPVTRGAASGPGAILWDPMAGEIDAAGFEGVDAVVHLAGANIGAKRWSEPTKREVRESRLRGTDLLARTLAGLHPRPSTLLCGSAMGYYGDTGDEDVTETSPPGDDFFARLAVEWEAAAQPAVDAGIRTAYLRTSMVLTGSGGALGRMVPLFRWGVGGRLGSGRQWWSWISIDDQVGAIRFLLERDDLAGPVNLASPDPITNAGFSKALGRALHRPAVVPVPAFGPRLVLGRELADGLVFTSQRVRPAVLVGAGYEYRHSDIDSALAAALTRKEDRA
jgi:uncharacterized protein (TIGR01777 family)